MKYWKLLIPIATSLVISQANADINSEPVSIPIDIQLSNTSSDIRNILMWTKEETEKELKEALIASIKFNSPWVKNIDSKLEWKSWRMLLDYWIKNFNKREECFEKNEEVWSMFTRSLLFHENIGKEPNPIKILAEIEKKVFWHKRTNWDMWRCD